MSDYEAKVERARAAVQAEQEALDAHEQALAARNEAINDALAAAPDNYSDNEVARQVGVQPSTFRSITGELRRQRRLRGHQRQV